MYLSVLARRLRPGKTYDDFLKAWYPEKGFELSARVTTAVNIDDDREVLTLGVHDVEHSPRQMREALTRIASQEAVRHDRIAEVVESTTIRGLFRVVSEYDFSTDDAVEKGRPRGVTL